MESSDQQVRSVADTRGKHRISAELKQLEQEARFLEVSLSFDLDLLQSFDFYRNFCDIILQVDCLSSGLFESIHDLKWVFLVFWLHCMIELVIYCEKLEEMNEIA